MSARVWPVPFGRWSVFPSMINLGFERREDAEAEVARLNAMRSETHRTVYEVMDMDMGVRRPPARRQITPGLSDGSAVAPLPRQSRDGAPVVGAGAPSKNEGDDA